MNRLLDINAFLWSPAGRTRERLKSVTLQTQLPKRLIKTFLNILFFLLCLTSRAQLNLVPNGSFEEHTSCPDNEDQVYKCVGWQKPNMATTDYAHVCAPSFPGGVTVPNYWMGYQWPYHGDAYMGLYGMHYSITPNVVAEYVQCQLIEPLKSMHRYRLSFFVNLANHSEYALRNFGGYVSETPPTYTTPMIYNAFGYNPQVKFPGYIIDTLDWVKVSGEFKATGGEQWLTIGRFDDAGLGNFSYIPVVPDTNPHPFKYCYYLLDSVSMYDVSTPADLVELPNVFTPNGDGKNDVFEMPVFSFHSQQETVIYNRWGMKVAHLTSGANAWDGTNEGTPCPAGIYYYVFTARNEEGKEYLNKGFVQLLR